MDYLKQQVVEAVFAKVRQVEGEGIYDIYDEPPTIQVMPQVEHLKLQLHIKTPAGPRFFQVIVKEVY